MLEDEHWNEIRIYRIGMKCSSWICEAMTQYVKSIIRLEKWPQMKCIKIDEQTTQWLQYY